MTYGDDRTAGALGEDERRDYVRKNAVAWSEKERAGEAMSDKDKTHLALLDFPECQCGKDKSACWELTIFADHSVGLACIRCWTAFDFIDETWVQA